MLSWILVGVLYLCGMVATFSMLCAASISGKFGETTQTWTSNPIPTLLTLLAWPLIIIAGVILGVYLLVKGGHSV